MRRGFSFVELLFAIMILGIGFIMIAAIFPVAIRQTAASGEETVASTIARGAVGVIQQFASNTTMPQTSGRIWPLGTVAGTIPTAETPALALYNAVSGNMILPSDNRYAWAAMYERDAITTPYAQVIVVGMQVRNRTQYTSADTTAISITPNTNNYPVMPNLQPKPVQVYFTPGGGTVPDQVTFVTTANTPEAQNANAAAEGSYLVIADDLSHSTQRIAGATCNGYIYRIGNQVSTNVWQLMPGNDVYTQSGAPATPISGSTNPMNALMIGRSIHDPTQAYDPTNNPYEGLSQDISVYVSFVRINS